MVNKFNTKIIDRVSLTENTQVLTLDVKGLEYQAGQFLTFIVKDKHGKPKPRSYSLLNPSGKTTQLLVEFIQGGIASEQFKKATPKTEFTVMGPLGKFVFMPESKKHVFIATNTGLAPVHCMIAQYLDKGYDMTLIFGGRTKDRLYFHDDFVTLDATDDSFTYKPTLSREQVEGISHGYVQNLIEIDTNAQYYICGNGHMVKDVRNLLEENHIPKENVHFEIFD